MKFTRRRQVVAGVLSLMVVGWAMGQYDYARLVGGKRPFFARVRLYPDDGGSVQYLGLGYAVTDHHQLWGMEPQPTHTNAPSIAVQYRVGPTLHYLIPFMSREHLSLIIETNK